MSDSLSIDVLSKNKTCADSMTNQLRICIVCPFRGPNRTTLKLAIHLARKGMRIDLMHPSFDPDIAQNIDHLEDIGHIEILTANRGLGNIGQRIFEVFYSVIALGSLLSKRKTYDILYLSGTTFLLALCAMIKPLLGSILVFDDAGPLPEFLKPRLVGLLILFLKRIVYHRIDGIVFSSGQAYSGSMISRLHISIPTIVSPPGMDMNEFRPSHEIRSFTEPIILIVGDILPRKNQLSVVRAANLVILEYPGVNFVFAGRIVDKEYYRQMLSELWPTTSAKVKFEGRVSEARLRALYEMADIFVLVSLNEATALVMVEAMSFGKAIVASRIRENAECAVHGDEMLLVNPLDYEEMAAAIGRLLAEPCMRKELGEHARRTAVEHYSLEVMLTKRTKFLLELASTTKQSRSSFTNGHATR